MILCPRVVILQSHFSVRGVLLEFRDRPVFDPGVDGRWSVSFASFAGQGFELLLRFGGNRLFTETEVSLCFEGDPTRVLFEETFEFLLWLVLNRRHEGRLAYLSRVDEVVGQTRLEQLQRVIQHHRNEPVEGDVVVPVGVDELEGVCDYHLGLQLHELGDALHEMKEVAGFSPLGVEAFEDPFGPKSLITKRSR